MGASVHKHTRVIATFHSDEGFDGEVNLSHPDFGRLVGFTWQKSFGGASGAWSLTFKRGAKNADPMELWRDPEDVWCRIDVQVDGVRKPLMLGLVDTIAEDLSRSGQGARDETYTISGKDFGKVFEQTELYINIYEQEGAIPLIPLYTAVQDRLLGTPGEVLRTVIDAWVGNHGAADKQWTLPASLQNGQDFFSLLTQKLPRNLKGRIYDPNLYSPDRMMGRRLWDTLQEYSNPVMNELWCDYLPNRPAGWDRRGEGGATSLSQRLDLTGGFDSVTAGYSPVITLRERPFPTTDQGTRAWAALTTHDIHTSQVMHRNTTKGNASQRFNFWLIKGMGFGGDGVSTLGFIQERAAVDRGMPGSAPIYNLDSIRKHGFRKWEQPTRYFPFKEDPQWLLHSAQWLKMIHDWYVIAPEQTNGSMALTYIHPAIRIGDRIREHRREGEEFYYYVEGVQHSYMYANGAGHGTTNLTLTRGENAHHNLLEEYYTRVVNPANRRLALEQLRLLRADLSEDEIAAEMNALGSRLPDVTEASVDSVEDVNRPVDAADIDAQTDAADAARIENLEAQEAGDVSDLGDAQVRSDYNDAVDADVDAADRSTIERDIGTGEDLPTESNESGTRDAASDRNPEENPRRRSRRNPRNNRGGGSGQRGF